MANRFCAHCGAKLLPDARFCAQCGQPLQGGAGKAGARLPLARFAPLVVVAAVLAVIGVTVLIGSQNANPPNLVPPRSGPAANAGGASGAPGAPPAMPEGHPPVAVPDDVKQVIVRLVEAAKSKPDDVETWLQLGFVQYRAGQIEPAYLADAQATYTHILEKQPDNLDAIRALGNIAYDRNDAKQALVLYDRYLKIKPDDLSVQTDRGTMLLAGEQVEAALKTYQDVLAVDPKFFQAQFNIAIAHRAAGDNAKAIEALQRAREIAPDEETRQRVTTVLARVTGGPEPGGAPAGAPAAPASDLRSDVETLFRTHQITGAKLDRVDWPSPQTARVILREFPMEGMPPFAREKFFERIKTTVRDSKSRHQVTETVKIELVDAATGRVMDSVSE